MRLLPWCLLALAAPAIAQPDRPPPGPDGGPRGPGRFLARADVPDQVARGFALIDADGDGVVTRAEADRYRAQRRAAMRARQEGGGDGGDDRPPPPPPGGGRGAGPLLANPAWFGLADPQNRGRVTLPQAQAGALALFDRLDADHNGRLDRDERRAGMNRGAGWRGAGPDGG